MASDSGRAGSSGIVRITCQEKPTTAPRVETAVNNDLVLVTLAELRISGLRAVPSGDLLSLVLDVHIWLDRSIYLVRPLTRASGHVPRIGLICPVDPGTFDKDCTG